MESFKQTAGNMAGNLSGNLGSLTQDLQGINFPISKDNLLNTLQQKGVPGQICDKIRQANTNKFDSPQQVLSEVQGRGR